MLDRALRNLKTVPVQSPIKRWALGECGIYVVYLDRQIFRTWKKLAREPGNPIPISSPMVIDRRPSIELVDMRGGKNYVWQNVTILKKKT